MILGIDVSTSITGYAVIDDNGELLCSVSCDTRRNHPTVFDVLDKNEKVLIDIKNKYNIKNVFIEDNLLAYGTGFSNAKTIVKLAKMNALMCYKVKEVFGQLPEPIKPNTARKLAEIELDRSSSKSNKEQTHEIISAREPKFIWEKTYAGNPKPESYDRSDAIVIARAGEKLLAK
jgi:hypothetical protein